MRRIACTLLLGVVTGGATAAQATESARPSLDLVRLKPLVIRGEHFKPGERVGVYVSGAVKASRSAVATQQGSFVVRFRVRLERCDHVIVRAFGSRGSRARTVPLDRPDYCPPSR